MPPIPPVRVPALIGRDRELAVLGSALTTPPAIVLVEGEAGIGKSRLVADFVGSPAMRRHHALLAACPPFRQPLTLSPVVDSVREAAADVAGLRLSPLAGALRPLIPEWAPDLPPAPEPLTDPSAARHRLFRALAEILAQLRVTVLIVEDAHWADEATTEFLLFITTRQPQRLSLIVTYRPEDVPAASSLRRLSSRQTAALPRHRLVLNPLDADGTSALVSSMLNDEPVSPGFANRLHRDTEGLPLAVEESVRLLRDRSDLHRESGAWDRRHYGDLDVPPTVRDAVLERTGRLDDDARAVLRAAAVLTDAAGEPLLGLVTGLAPAMVRAGLDRAADSGLLAEDSRGLVSFRHALAARAVHETIPVRDKREMHLRAGTALQNSSSIPAARLIRHFREAGKTSLWCRYAERAADAALAAGDAAVAAALLHDLITHADITARTIARLAAKLPLRGLREHAVLNEISHSLRAALESGSLTAAQRANIRAKLGEALVCTWNLSAGTAELERALPDLAHSPGEAARAMSLLGVPDYNLWPRRENRSWLDRAAETAKDPAVSTANRLRVTITRAFSLLAMGCDEGWAEAARIPADATDPDEIYCIATAGLNVGDSVMRLGQYREARQRLEAGLELSTREDYPRLRGCLLSTLTHVDWFLGSWGGLAARAQLLTEHDEPMVALEASLVCGLLAVAAGRNREAASTLARVIDGFQRLGMLNMPLEPAATLARLRLSDGDAAAAVALTDGPMVVITSKGIWEWATEVAPVRMRALVACGRHAEAARLVSDFGTGLRGSTSPAPLAALAQCQAIAASARGQHDHAASLYSRADEAWLALPRPYKALLVREQSGRCLIAAGQIEAGLAVLREVFRELADLGADGDAERVVRLLRGRGERVPRLWRHGRNGYGNQLSPREIEVVRLVVAGHTNQEIANQLCRSVSTVRTQLSSAMRKVGASSRAGLAARVAASLLVPSHFI